MSPTAYTGTWTCPTCGELVPVTMYGHMDDSGVLRFDDEDTPAPATDIHAHVWANHPEAN